MAIQLNERDYLIFNLIEEHKVLLEKHISWFIASEAKPVLIRDRLRKLFYLDYLLSQKHNAKLPWWTTPTKPLVYLLAPIAKGLIDSKAKDNEEPVDLFDEVVQRHYLEIANIRMLCLAAKGANEIESLHWTTCQSTAANKKTLDALITFRATGQLHKVGIINHPNCEQYLADDLAESLRLGEIDSVAIVSRDETHQEAIHKLLGAHKDQLDLNKIFLVTHHELYKSGIAHAHWCTANRQPTHLISPAASSLPTTPEWRPAWS